MIERPTDSDGDDDREDDVHERDQGEKTPPGRVAGDLHEEEPVDDRDERENARVAAFEKTFHIAIARRM
jgi:hypothetical protein